MFRKVVSGQGQRFALSDWSLRFQWGYVLYTTCWTGRVLLYSRIVNFYQKNPNTFSQRKDEFQKNTAFVHCNRQLTCQSQMLWGGLDYLSPANSAGLFSTNQILFGKFECLNIAGSAGFQKWTRMLFEDEWFPKLFLKTQRWHFCPALFLWVKLLALNVDLG